MKFHNRHHTNVYKVLKSAISTLLCFAGASLPATCTYLCYKPDSNYLGGMTNNQTNSNNENVLMIDVKPATANGNSLII